MASYERLLEISQPWVCYLVLRDLLGVPTAELQELHQGLLAEPYIQTLLASIKEFHTPLVSAHKNPGLNINHVLMLQALDLNLEVPQIKKGLEQILAHRDELGIYQSRGLLPAQYGGDGVPGFGWALCDAPLLMLAVIQAGLDYNEFVKPGLENLAAFQFEQGFSCVVSKELGKWRGPGRKSDPSPIATLWMLRLYAALPNLRESPQAKALAEVILSLWERSLEAHPYMFFMGTDFRKIKAPAVWYDIVSVCDVLRLFPWLSDDLRFQQMKQIIRSKANPEGLFTPESIYMSCKTEDFGQKKQPSAYLSFLCQRILIN